jgi:uncharacterized protein (TIGR02145 family)
MRSIPLKNFLFVFSFVFAFAGCTLNRVGSGIATSVRFSPLKQFTDVELIYTPQTMVNIAEHSEFFYNVNPSEGAKYESDFIATLFENNIKIGGDSSRFVVEVSQIIFTETVHQECRVDTATNENYCFWLNDVELTVNTTVYDRDSGKSQNFSSNVTESTRIKSRLIGKGYKESGYLIRNSSYIPTLINSCFKKSSGKVSRFIKKQHKKDAKRDEKRSKMNPKNEEIIAENDFSSEAQTIPTTYKEIRFYDDKKTGERYELVQLCNSQTWMKENLRTAYFRNGDKIPESQTVEEWNLATISGKPTWIKNNFSVIDQPDCGKLYNWFAVIDQRGLAPEGWHIPSENEWTTMLDCLGPKKGLGLQLKSTSGWNNKTMVSGNESWDGNGHNTSDLNCLPCGQFGAFESGNLSGYKSFWWNALEKNKKATGMILNSNGKIKSSKFNPNKGYSVRCVRD